MASFGYSDLARHAAEHAKLLLEVKGYQDNTVFNARQLTLVLSNWLMSHSMQEDRPFADYVLRGRASGIDELSNSFSTRAATGERR
jgi:hemerythrin